MRILTAEHHIGRRRNVSTLTTSEATVDRSFSTQVRTSLGHAFWASTPSAELTAYLDELYAALPTPEPGRQHAAHYEMLRDPSGGWSVTRDGERIGRATHHSQVLGSLLWAVNRGVVGGDARSVVFHAGGVTIDGQGVVIAGDMEAGKTTLVTGLLLAGADYLSDEAVGLDANAQLVYGYPKALSLDPGAWPLFPALEPIVDDAVRPFLPHQWQVPPDAIASSRVRTTASPRFIVLVRYEDGAETVLRSISGSKALRRLAGCVFPTTLPMATMLQRLGRLLSVARCVELTYSDLNDGVTQVQGLVRGTTRLGAAEHPREPEPSGVVPASSDSAISPERHRDEATVSLEQRVRRRSDVSRIDVSGEVVLHDARTDQLYRLNPLGTAIWDRLDGRANVREVIDAIIAADRLLASSPTKNGVETDVPAGHLITFLAEVLRADLAQLV
jgi:hypothetical protein